jgi:hypothetical protein
VWRSYRPGLFTGCAEAVGEVGGFSHTLDERRRAYFVSTAEKVCGGHGSSRRAVQVTTA